MVKIDVEKLPPVETASNELVSTNPDTRAKYQVSVPASHIVDNILLNSQFDPKVFDPEVIKEHFHNEGRLSESQTLNLLNRALKIFKKEQNLLQITRKSRIVVIGDIHGQFYDLLYILNMYDLKKDVLVFLGDYVDRGRFSTEVFFYLISLKCCYPKNIYLLRGNHETLKMTQYFTFKEECIFKYSSRTYDKCLDVFCALPLVAVLNEAYFCCHGGISPNLKKLSDVNSFDRFREPPFSGLFCDLLWSDPHPRFSKGVRGDFFPNTQRNCSYFFTQEGVENFLRKNDLLCILRGHEVQPRGYRQLEIISSQKEKPEEPENVYGFFYKPINEGQSFLSAKTILKNSEQEKTQAEKNGNQKEFQKSEENGSLSVVTIFSAPNYCDCYGNDGGVCEIFDKKIQIKTFKAVSHPFYLPSYLDAVNWSFPFVSEKASEFFLDLLKFLDDRESVSSTNGETGICDEIQQTTNFTKAMVILRTEREGCCEIDEESSELPSESIKDPDVAATTFEEVKALDENNEKIKTDDDIVQALSVDDLSASCAGEVSKVLEEEDLSEGIQNCTLDTSSTKTIGVKIEPSKEQKKTWSPLSCFLPKKEK